MRSKLVAITAGNYVAPDSTAPVISGGIAINTGPGAVTFTWQTNEPSTSQVKYSTDMSFGSSSPLDATLALNHSVTVTGLASDTLYNWKLESKDATNNLGTSPNSTIMVDWSPLIFGSSIKLYTDSRMETPVAQLTGIAIPVEASGNAYGLNQTPAPLSRPELDKYAVGDSQAYKFTPGTNNDYWDATNAATTALALNGAQAMTTCIVYKTIANTGAFVNRMVNGGTNDGWAFQMGQAVAGKVGSWNDLKGSWQNTAGAPTNDGMPHAALWQRTSGLSQTLKQDGMTFETVTGMGNDAPATGLLQIGRSASGGTYMNGHLPFSLVLDRVLTAPEEVKLWKYLATYYWIVPPLPTLSYIDDGTPEPMDIPHPRWISRYVQNASGTAWYVDAINGNDANSGLSYALAKQTFNAVWTAITAGDTINCAAGNYLIGDYTLAKAGSIIQAYPLNLAPVYFDGRTDLSGATWTKDGAFTRWYCTYNSPVQYANNVVAGGAAGADWANLQANTGNSSYPTDSNCVYANPVTIDGTIVTGVGSAGAVTPITHFHDHGALRLYIGVDPTGKTIKAPIYQLLFKTTATVTIRGIVGRCYTPSYGDTTNGQAMIRCGAATTIDNCSFGFSASDNLLIGASGCVITDSHFSYGLTGISVNSGVAGLTYTNLYSHHNNTIWKYSQRWHCGGYKMAGASAVVATWCVAANNRGPGFWRDFSTNGNIWSRCYSQYNVDFGFVDEKTLASDNTTNANRTVSCVALGNNTGYYSLGAVNSVVEFNTFVNNRTNFYMTEDNRATAQHTTGLIYNNNIHSMTVGHSVVAGTAPSRHVYWDSFSEDINTSLAFTGGSMKNNAWHTDPSVSMALQFSSDNGTAVANYATRALWLAGNGSGLDAGGITSSASGNPWLTDPINSDFSIKAGAAVIGAGIVTTALTRDKGGVTMGLADTVTPTIGAPVAVGARR